MRPGMIRLCGGIAVADATGDPVDLRPLGGRRGRALFARLVMSSQPVAREALAEQLWSGAPPTTWPSALRTALTSVRQVSRSAGWGDALDTSQGLLRLVLPAWTTIDVVLAERSVRDAEHALAHLGDPLSALALASEAAGLVEAPPLPDLDDEWAELLRGRTHLLHVRALEAWAAASLAVGRHDDAAEVAERAIRAAPLGEGPYRTAMAAHRAAGRRSDALRTYERLRAGLADELGVYPSAATHALYLELLDVPEWATAPVADTASLPTTLEPHDEPPFVGRADVMAQLSSWWEDRSSRCTFAVLRGESGVGKSRVASELARAVHRSGGEVLHAIVDEGAGPIGVLRDLTRRLSGASELIDELTTTSGLPEDELVGSLHDLADLVIAEVDSGGRLLVVVDDVHWATRPMLVVLRRLLARAEPPHLRVLLTARGEGMWGSGWAALVTDARRAGRLLDVELQGLDAVAVAELIGRVGARDEPGLADQLCALTAGNALLVSQAVRYLSDGGMLGADAPIAGLAVGVREPVIGRVASLGEGVLPVLRVAAVLGPSFELVLLADLVDGGLDAAVRSVDAAITGSLVHSVGYRPGTYRFVHALVREALLQTLSEPARLALHRSAALALRSGRHRPDPFALAWHLVAAAPLGDVAAAAAAAEDAALLALRSFDHDGALALVRRALALPLDDAARSSLLVVGGRAGLAAGESHDAHDAFVEAFHLARRAGDPRRAARAALGAMHGFRGGSEWMPEEERRELGELALADVPDSEALLRVELLGQVALRTPDTVRRQQLAAEAMRVSAESRDDAAVVASLVASRISLWAPERSVERLDHGRLVEAAALRIDDRAGVVDARFAQMGDLVQLGRLDDVRALLALLDADPAVHRSARRRWHRRLWDVVLATVEGRLDDIAPSAAAAFDEWGDPSHVDAIQAFGNQLAVEAAMRGRLGDLVDQAAAWARDNAAVRGFGVVHAWAAAEAGRRDEAGAAVSAALAAGLPEDNTLPIIVVALAETAARLGDADLARTVLPAARAMAGQLAFLPGPCVFFGPLDHALGLLHATVGERDAAVEHLAAAVERGASCGPFWRDRSAAVLASVLASTNGE